MKQTKNRRLAVLDFETDPFKAGRMPVVFAAGFFDGETFVHFWGAECLPQMLAFLAAYPEPLAIFAHNGGRFDFFFILPHLENPLQIIAGRIVTAKLGRHELRDSFAILPVPLSSYEKTEIDYAKFEADQRDRNRDEIVSYLRDDCCDLFALVEAFERRFGRRLTTASTAMRELQRIRRVPTQGSANDARFRPFYFGGRVECFEAGILRDKFIIADVNSMYPHAMANFEHPCGGRHIVRSGVDIDDPRLAFAHVDATSRGALPVRARPREGGGLRFPHERAEYMATVHELRAGLELGLIDVHKVREAFYFERRVDFGAFVAEFMRDKVAAEIAGDKAGRIFAKLMLNAAYGKWAQRPDAFADYMLRRSGEPLPSEDWSLYSIEGVHGVEVWERESNPGERAFYDVAIGASITGAARACLLRAIASADRPVYCDTDSIICRSLGADQRMHATELGAWKIEERADTVAIAGKKMYTCSRAGEYVKWAAKGVDIKPSVIVDIAAGRMFKYVRESPSLTLKGWRFINREVRSTHENRNGSRNATSHD